MIKVIIISLTLILFSFSAYSGVENPAEINEKSVVSMDEATQDMMNRFVLAFFGKEALQIFTPYKIDGIDNAIVEQYISPFPNFFSFLGYTFIIVALLAFCISVFYLFFILYDGLFKSQKSGDILGSNWNKLFLVIKISISLILTLPMITPNGIGYNGTQFLVFYAFGKSKVAGDNIIRDFSNNNPSVMPEVPLPQYYGSGRVIANEFLAFAECINSNSAGVTGDGKSDVVIEQYVSDNDFYTYATKRNCNLRVKFPLNSNSFSIINNNKELSEYFSSKYLINSNFFPNNEEPYYNYASGMIEGYNVLFRDMLKKSSIAMNAFMFENRGVKFRNLDAALEGFSFNNYVEIESGGQRRQRWELTCDQFFNKIKNLDVVTDFDSWFIKTFASNCISYELMSSVSLPRNNEDRSNILNNNRDFYIMCRDNNSLVNDVFGDFESSCLENYCGSLNQKNNQSYLCSYSIETINYQKEQESFDSLGFLVFGATIYNRFSNLNPSSSKQILNDIEASFSLNIDRIIGDLFSGRSANRYYKETIDLEIGNENYDFYRNFDSGEVYRGVDFNVDFANLIQNNKGGNSSNHSNIALVRLPTCISEPLSFQGNYVCGSVLQEINRFGMSSINSFLDYHTSRMVGAMHRRVPPVRRDTGAGSDSGWLSRGIELFSNSPLVRAFGTNFIIQVLRKFTDVSGERDDFDSGVKGDLFRLNNTTVLNNSMSGLISGSFEQAPAYIGYIQGYTGNKMGVITSFIYMVLFAGIIMAFVIPLIPFWIFTVAAINIISLFILKVYSLSFLAGFIMKPSKDHNSDILQNFMATIFEILFKIPFLIIGLIVSWLLTNTLISKIFIIFNPDNLFFTGSGFGVEIITQLAFTVVYSFVYLFIFFKFTSFTVSMIDDFEKMSMSLMRGQQYSFTGNDSITKVFSQSKQYFYYGMKVKKRQKSMNTPQANFEARKNWGNLSNEASKTKDEFKEEFSNLKEKVKSKNNFDEEKENRKDKKDKGKDKKNKEDR